MNGRDARRFRDSPDPLVRAEAEATLAETERRRKVRLKKSRPRRRASAAAHELVVDGRALVRAECVARAKGCCEHCRRYWGSGLHLDHFWGKAREESVESCWMLCPDCDHEKTVNDPSRVEWFRRFLVHCRRYRYQAQLDKLIAAADLELAQHPEHRESTPRRGE